MQNLTARIGDRTWTLTPAQGATVGRDPGSTVQVDEPRVSRNHAQLRHDGTGWVLVDTGSSGGTWLNGVRVTEVRVAAHTEVRLGAIDGPALVLVPEGAAQRPAAPVLPTGVAPGLAQTVLPGTGPTGPGYVGGPGVVVRVGGTTHRFPPGSAVRIGRDPAGEVVVDDPSVSRLHGVVEGRPDGWWYVDRSSAGTWRDADRVTQLRLDEPTTLVLGHPTAGVEVEVVPVVDASQAQRSIARKKRKGRGTLVAGIAAVAVIAAAGVGTAVVLTGDDGKDGPGRSDDPGLSTAELDRAKLASVLILAVGPDGQVLGNGSGSVISEDGLILTNAHVADPDAPGQNPPGEEPAGYKIALVSPSDDEPAAPSFTAETIVSDGVLDLAVMKITGDAEGNAIDEDDLDLPEPLELADSDDVRTGDQITALGYPAIAHVATGEEFERRALTVTRGVVSTFLQERPIHDSRAWIDSDIRIGSGNSGGASINEDGEIIGINTAVVTEATVGGSGEGGAFTGGSARIRPVNFARDIIEIAQEGGDPSYVSPFLEELPDQPADPMGGEASASGAGWSLDGGNDCSVPSTIDSPQTLSGVSLPGTLYAHFAVNGLPDGTPFRIDVYDPQATKLGSLDGVWSLGAGEVCAQVQLELPAGLDGANAVLVVGETSIENPVWFQ
ncbi:MULTISPECIES: FHA domain-containing protein [unclassified Nocardioides]|uniref:FHA domain-containing protein n=1 Tax=unclassified Nocardioides TaxID=2615069 RepID=UPI00048DBC5A|nr:MULTISPECIES: FHA domain-containing protein [unclassified Nocardioides]